MAINSFEKHGDKITSRHSSNLSKVPLPSCHMVKLSITTDGSTTSSDLNSCNGKNKNMKSPYLIGDSVQLLSRVTEKKLYTQHKKADFLSSFPLAASIYRANSDEFKSQKRGNKKVKKSVLTLPNIPTDSPQMCTVSDTNDSKYADRCVESRALKPNKRMAQNRKSRVRNKNYEFYDRDARYCSQMNISLDCSSTDVINQFRGDGKKVTGKARVREGVPNEEKINAHDVWAVLRNINRFQFRPSPPMSEDSIQTVKKKKIRNKRKNNRKDTRVIETCRTQEFAYISSYDVETKSPISFSRSSSFDRVTVIDKQDEFDEICKELGSSIIKTKNVNPFKNRQAANKNYSKKNTRNNDAKTIIIRGHDDRLGPQIRTPREQNKCPDNNIEPYKFVIENINNPETLVSIDYNSKKFNGQKKLSNKRKVMDATVFRKNVSTGTLHSGSSKAAVTSDHFREDCDKLMHVSSTESSQQPKGITKVVLSKGQNVMLSKQANDLDRKPRLETTLPKSSLMPRLTKTETKRQLANLRFPIVILGKDQITSTAIQVMNCEPVHLQGLDQRIWPFMQDWYDTCINENENECANQKKADDKSNDHVSKMKSHCIERKNVRKTNEITKIAAGKDKIFHEDSNLNKKRNAKRPVPPNEIIKIKAQMPKKPKPIHQLKDKMLKLLYKNKDVDNEQFKISSNIESTSSCNRSIEVKQSTVPNKVDIGIGTVMKYELVSQNLSRQTNLSPKPEMKKKAATVKQPWAKAKWASDFIETVIKKIRSGVYYNQDNRHQITDVKEISVQTILTGKIVNLNETIMKDEIIQKTSTETLPGIIPIDYLGALPGFDERLPALEIKTLNMKEVAVKHCTTNVMVQFDVAPPSEARDLNSSQMPSSFMPLTVTESQTKIFKCKTTIINAMLPAEICSILPKIILSLTKNTSPTPPSAPPYQGDCLLYTISELSNSESQDLFKPALPSITYIPPKLLAILENGEFSTTKVKSKQNHLLSLTFNLHNDLNKAANLLLKLSMPELRPYNYNIFPLNPCEAAEGHIEKKRHMNSSIDQSCTALELYNETKPNLCLETIFGNCESNSINNMCNQSNIFPFSLNFDGNKIIMKMPSHNNYGYQEQTSIIISHIDLTSLYKGLEDGLQDKQFKAIEYNTDKSDNQYNPMQKSASNIKVRKNKFVKLYKKCKSTSSISGEKNSTQLSKIISLEDFLQALGTGKLLSSIFDGLSEKKILTSLLEMKNWITEISQRQAMLVLLLTNKKDTPNLVRFRPILLQGIAVNRITRASELDMEIEVIETENFQKLAKFEGIPYISESAVNKDILLEELYWIAKTTASDYQKPFNEASEKLLKSLLEKRKKLNPSYLRVMARYVGLGLLKCPNKN